MIDITVQWRRLRHALALASLPYMDGGDHAELQICRMVAALRHAADVIDQPFEVFAVARDGRTRTVCEVVPRGPVVFLDGYGDANVASVHAEAAGQGDLALRQVMQHMVDALTGHNSLEDDLAMLCSLGGNDLQLVGMYG
jgi:hypothetical protein